MKIKMTLLSDTIFGNGMSVPGAEDISVLTDEYGFPYFKGGTMKGIFREELKRLLEFEGKSEEECKREVAELMGKREGASIGYEESEDGSMEISEDRKLVFSDFKLSENVRNIIKEEIGSKKSQEILDILTNIRTFTRINEEGIVQDGSLRMARCVNKGLVFYSEIICQKQDEDTVREVLGMIKCIGTMRNRGFGNVKISVVEGV